MYKKIFLTLTLIILIGLSCTTLSNNLYWDLSQNKINSLSDTTKNLIKSLDSNLVIEVYSPKAAFLTYCHNILGKYAHQSKKVKLVLKQALLDPQQATKLKVQSEHNLVVTYQKQQQGIDIKPADLTEENISNLILRATVKPNTWAAFLSGHQEADPFATDLFGLSAFAKIIKDHGFQIASLNLIEQQQIPANTDTIIVVNPQIELLSLEKGLLHKFLENGGKLLWFTEPDSPATSFIQSEFGINVTPGVVVDPNSLKLGSPHPAIKIIASYPEHTITKNIKAAVIMPWSANLHINDNINAWQSKNLITTGAQTWTYTGSETENIKNLQKHKGQQGPLTLGIALNRNHDNTVQNAVLIADSSFILNKYLSLYSNAQFASNMLSWLQSSQQTLAFNAVHARDLSFAPTHLHLLMIRYGFAIFLPLLLLGTGYFITMRPRS
jgi:hypothetical protein